MDTNEVNITVTAKEMLDFLLQRRSGSPGVYLCHVALVVARNKSATRDLPHDWSDTHIGFEIMERLQQLHKIRFDHVYGQMSSGIHTYMREEDVARFVEIGDLHIRGTTGVSEFVLVKLAHEHRFLLRVGILVELLRVDPECSFEVSLEISSED